MARPEAEATDVTTDAADGSSVGGAASAARESPDEGRGRRNAQIMRHSRVSGIVLFTGKFEDLEVL